ncbi:MAG TPA: heliorhodopsin HeR [Candidatus Saccharimonadales bacterium]|nr:heliorhodopsin HeR [Candidatus Saccharimonadales bacterium]
MAKKKEETKAKSKPAKQAKAAKSSATAPAVAKEAKETKKETVKESAVAPARTVKPAVTTKQDVATVLQRWHMVVGVVLAVQGLLVALVSSSKAVPVILHYPAIDTLASEANKRQVLGVAGHQLFDIPIAYLLSAALLALAVIYIAAATNFRTQFEAVLSRGVNVARWTAYAVGGALLLDAVLLLSGVNDLFALKLLAASLVTACVAGLAVDLLGPGRPGLSKLLKVVSAVSGVVPWLAIAGILTATMLYDGTVPSYMYGVYASGFILYVATALAILFRWQGRGRFANALYSEKILLLLGLVTATVLTWQIFAGALL